MAQYPKYTFDDNTDYSLVYATDVQMYSDLNAQLGCNVSKSIKETFGLVNTQFAVMPYNLANNLLRWQENVKNVYLLLYPLT